MQILIKTLYAVFRKEPLGILFVLALDIVEIIFLSTNPTIIGICIDGILTHSYSGLCLLLFWQFSLVAIRTINKLYDTRVYEKIIAAESNSYYGKIIQTNSDDSQISSRLNLICEIVAFFETDLIQILNIFFSVAVALIYLLANFGVVLVLVAIFTSFLVFFFTKEYHRKIADNNMKLQNCNETRENIISSRDERRFNQFTKTILHLEISGSDWDAKACLGTDMIQTGFLIFAILYAIYTVNYTSGQLFAAITYIMMLNDYICEINVVRVKVYDLMDDAIRLEGAWNEY